ncbi:PaaI family thioesterase [Zestomonas carbonaria]|uniref:Thioesterase domain-containing protein n=1 Tax=Zestomonas carbonaria TaxID=2762745 RepID=A0A7U7I7T7_9GAMM|nr:PaaI family thioesterase [Pseudomonas carbonaria]CAD5106011.1 hypothetical protein PSEWESI4_00270 [Pseudomonas carbonaria]
MTIDAEQLQLYTAYRGIDIPLLDHLKLRYCPPETGEEQGHIILKVEREHLNGWRSAHGGVIMTLLDVAMALASSHSDEQQRGVVTIEMKSNFLRPGGDVGETLEAFGKVRHHTHSLAFCEAELRNSAGDTVATASGTFKYLNKPRPLADA